MKAKVIQTHNVKPQNPLCNGKNLIRKQNLNMFLPLGILVLLVLFSVLALTPLHTSAEDGSSSATDSASADVGVNVGLACTLSGSNTTHAITLSNGSYNDNITGTTLHTICNGSGNYNIYAIGYTNNTDGNNTLDGKTSGTIPTGTTLDGKVSNWAMKLAYTSGSGDDNVIQNGYDSFSVIPATSTAVASYNASSSQTTDSTLQTTYGVSISPNQPAGTYTGQVKYTMSHTNFTMPYMQDFTLDLCKYYATTKDAIVYDRRDNSDYTVRYINGACWMTQNLRITGTISAEYSNFTGDDVNISEGDLASGNSYTEARTHVGADSNGNATVWYNFCAAAAKSGANSCKATASYSGSESICPSGWKLPTNLQFGDMIDAAAIGDANDTSYFRPVYGGYYANGLLRDASAKSGWWSSTAFGSGNLYYLYYEDGSLDTNASLKYIGYFVRCVRTS